MLQTSNIQYNLSLFRYNLGLIFLGSVAWIPFVKSKSYYSVAQAAWDWFMVFGGLFLAAFAIGSLLAGAVALLPFRNWPFEKKFYRVFLLSGLLLIPLLTGGMIVLGFRWEFLP